MVLVRTEVFKTVLYEFVDRFYSLGYPVDLILSDENKVKYFVFDLSQDVVP